MKRRVDEGAARCGQHASGHCEEPLHAAGTIIHMISAGASKRLIQVCGSRPGAVIESPAARST